MRSDFRMAGYKMATEESGSMDVSLVLYSMLRS